MREEERKEEEFIPDFSGDDFANDPSIRRQRQLQKEHDALVNEALHLISVKWNGTERDEAPALTPYFLFRSLAHPLIRKVFSAEFPARIDILVISYHSFFPTGKGSNSGTDDYIFGLLHLGKKYPRSYICRETIKEKIGDLFLRLDLDFAGQKKFSKKFHLVTEDKKALADLLVMKPLDDLAPFTDLELELEGHGCFFRTSRKALSIREAENFSALVQVLHQIFS